MSKTQNANSKISEPQNVKTPKCPNPKMSLHQSVKNPKGQNTKMWKRQMLNPQYVTAVTTRLFRSFQWTMKLIQNVQSVER